MYKESDFIGPLAQAGRLIHKVLMLKEKTGSQLLSRMDVEGLHIAYDEIQEAQKQARLYDPKFKKGRYCCFCNETGGV